MSPVKQDEARPDEGRIEVKVIVRTRGETRVWHGCEAGVVADALANLARRATMAVGS